MADYDSPDHWPPAAQQALDVTIWPVPGRATPETADTGRRCLEWHGPGNTICFNMGRHGDRDVSGPCDTQEQAQRAVETYIATYFYPLPGEDRCPAAGPAPGQLDLFTSADDTPATPAGPHQIEIRW